ncbi:MAG: hypothetical protein WD226_12080 [Planctomycetota bacterium]
MFRPLTLFLLLGTAGCGALRDDEPRVDRALLAHISENDRQAVAAERNELADARDSVATAKSDFERAKMAHKLAQDELDLAKQRVEAKRASVRLVRQPGGRDDIEAAENELQQAIDREEALQTKVKLRRHQVQLAEAAVNYEEARVDLAEAQVELTMANAVATVERTDVDPLDVERFQERVRQARTEVEVAKVKMEAAAQDVAYFQDLYNGVQDEEMIRPFERVDPQAGMNSNQGGS